MWLWGNQSDVNMLVGGEVLECSPGQVSMAVFPEPSVVRIQIASGGESLTLI